MSVKLVLLDADGVLVQFNPAVSDALKKKFSLTDGDLEFTWTELYPKLMVGNLTTEHFLDLFAAHYSIDRATVSKYDFTGPYADNLRLIDGMEDIVGKLSRAGMPLALLSDTSQMFHDTRRDLKIFASIKHHFLSYDLGDRKPVKRVFQAVIDHFSLQPEEIFFVDDNEQNVASAKSLGMLAERFTNADSLVKTLRRLKIL